MAVWVGPGAKRGWEVLAELVVRAQGVPLQDQPEPMGLPSRCQTDTVGTEAPDTLKRVRGWWVAMAARVETVDLEATEATEAPAGTVLRALQVLTEHKGVRLVASVRWGERAG